MNHRKCKFIIICLLLSPISVTGQEWSSKDSLKLKKLLESDQEIIINKNVIEMIEHVSHQSSSFVDFDPTLPVFKPSSTHILQFPANTKADFYLSNSTFLPTYSWQKLNKRLYLQSNSNFSKTSNYFHIQTIMEYRLSNKWSMNLYGMQNLNHRRYRGLPSEIIPTEFGGNVCFKLNMHWKIKTGIQYQHNMILRKWEWVPQCKITYSW